MTKLDRFSLWQAGDRALRSCGADAESAAAWTEIGGLLARTAQEPAEKFLREAATALDGLGTSAARAYAQACDALADKFDSGALSEETLFQMTERMETARLSPALRWAGAMLRSLGALKRSEDDAPRGLLTLGRGVLDTPQARRFGLTAQLLVSLSALGEEETLAETARCLVEALLREIDRQRRAALGAEASP